MLGMLRIAGIIVFALLVRVSANSLYKMHNAGILFEQYNSQRKVSTTLLVFSVTALVALVFFELMRLRRISSKRGYGGKHCQEDRDDMAVQASSIYAVPKIVDDWQGRKVRSIRPRKRKHAPVRDMHEVWMGLLRTFSIMLPIVYLGAFVHIYQQVIGKAWEAWLLPVLFSLILAALVFSVGVFRKKTWALSFGYILAIFNLVIFPIGTAIGLLLLIGLVGATPVFAEWARPRNRARTMA